jgi:hypothetical protein
MTKFNAAIEGLDPSSLTVQGGSGDLFMEIAKTTNREVWMQGKHPQFLGAS